MQPSWFKFTILQKITISGLLPEFTFFYYNIGIPTSTVFLIKFLILHPNRKKDLNGVLHFKGRTLYPGKGPFERTVAFKNHIVPAPFFFL